MRDPRMPFPEMEIYFPKECTVWLIIQLVVSPCILITLFMSQVLAAIPNSYDRGLVMIQGAITRSPCAISAGDREQTIDMGTVPVGDIILNGQGNTRLFSIMLVNCKPERKPFGLQSWKQFQVTFDGNADGALYGLLGEANGVALQIIDGQGNIATPGIPLPLNDIAPGGSVLNYSMMLVANNKPLKAGRYSAFVQFKLDYF